MRAVSLVVLVFFSCHFLCLAFPADAQATQTRLQRRAKPEVVEEPAAETEPGSYQACYTDGFERADQSFSSGGWFAGGVGAGLLLGLIGTGIIWAASKGDVMVPPSSYESLSGDCLQGYIDGYQTKAKSKKSSSAVGGGLLGTAIIVGIFLAASN